MKASIKRIWLKALRSGKYTQGRRHLETQGTYCCLGVLREVCPVSLRKRPGSELLGERSAARIGLTFQNQKTLAAMNDSGSTFECVAAYIEKYL